MCTILFLMLIHGFSIVIDGKYAYLVDHNVCKSWNTLPLICIKVVCFLRSVFPLEIDKTSNLKLFLHFGIHVEHQSLLLVLLCYGFSLGVLEIMQVLKVCVSNFILPCFDNTKIQDLSLLLFCLILKMVANAPITNIPTLT